MTGLPAGLPAADVLANSSQDVYSRIMELVEFDYAPYAKLLIRAGINLQPGQNLEIRYAPSGALLARKCAEEAYECGAGQVIPAPQDPHVTRARIMAQTGNTEALGAVPGWLQSWERTVVDEVWGFLALESFEDVGFLSDVDSASVSDFFRLMNSARPLFRSAVGAHKIPWCVAGVPGPNWAKQVLGPDAAVEQLWDLLRPILLLDRDNPVQAWKEKAQTLVERSCKLDALELDALHFEDEGTDLTVGLTSRALWKGGPEESNGLLTMPNIPTEEVFTTPDMNRCTGRTRVTKPVEIQGTMVKGASLVFENGKLVSFSAEEGQDALAGYVATDEGSCRLGEVALVGSDSPIAASGKNFSSILYDENAACHVALGSGYPSCLKDAHELTTDDAKKDALCNVSVVHLDMMISSPATRVTGLNRSGEKIAIMEKGRFVL